MPAEPPPPPRRVEEPDRATRASAARRAGDVLLADDDPTIRQVAARALQRLGFTVTSCADGQEAVHRFRVEPARWRLVVLDISMPILNGPEALQRIIEIRSDIAALIFSGYAEEDVRGRFAPAARVGYLQKPFTLSALSDAVASVLDAPAG